MHALRLESYGALPFPGRHMQHHPPYLLPPGLETDTGGLWQGTDGQSSHCFQDTHPLNVLWEP